MKDSAPSPSRARSRSIWVYAAIAVGVVILVVSVAVKIWLPRFILQEVERQAFARGIRLHDCALTFERRGWWELSALELVDCNVEAAGAFPARGTIERLHVDLEDNRPTKLVIAGAKLDVKGDLDWAGAKEQLNALSRESFEVLGERNRVAWFSDTGLPATIILSEVKRLASTDPWTANVAVMDVLEGTAVLTEMLSLRLHMKAQPTNYALITLDPQQLRAQVTAEMDRLPLALLSGTVFHNLPPELATTAVDARVQFAVPFGLNTDTPAGTFDLTFHGLNFPVPRELEGLVHDHAPQLSGELTSNRAYTRFDAHKLRFETGTLRMTGKARIQREDLHTQWAATMQGTLSCAAIVASAAKVHLNTELAQAARQISSRAIGGGVSILVAIDADSRDLAAAKVVKTVGVGCGLKPMPLTELVNLPLDLLKGVPELYERIRSAPKQGRSAEFPQLQLPDLKDLPKLEIPRIKLPNPRSREPAE